MFTEEEIESVLIVIRDRGIDIESSKTAKSVWTWPVVRRDREEIQLSDPYISFANKWTILDRTTMQKLNPLHQECIQLIKDSLVITMSEKVQAKHKEPKADDAKAGDRTRRGRPRHIAPAKDNDDLGLRSKPTKRKRDKDMISEWECDSSSDFIADESDFSASRIRT